MTRNMFHTSAKAATIPPLPARRSFLMVDGDLISELYTSVACRIVIYPPHQSSLAFHLITRPPISRTLSQHAHPFPSSAVFVGFCYCLWDHILSHQ